MRISLIFFLTILLFSCKQENIPNLPIYKSYNETSILEENKDHPIGRMQYKMIQSKIRDKNDIISVISPQLRGFDSLQYEALKPFILEKDIPSIQQSISQGKLSYKKLVQWYLYRIALYESDPDKTLHSIISINPQAVTQAEQADHNIGKENHPIHGMPILLKDNINTRLMKTTAGAAILNDFQPIDDALIVTNIKNKGGIILGKANLSEWAYFFCGGCPVGYSAIGGQTLNPYGRYIHETGGSSSGSGTTMAANYATAAVGTETSGSILSPSSSNSIVGLKPTIGLLSRSGIVPISSHLDTPGPMTRNVVDNSILLDAMASEDEVDIYTSRAPARPSYLNIKKNEGSQKYKLGVVEAFLEDSIYASSVNLIASEGIDVVNIDLPRVGLPGFLSILNIDMKNDLPAYFKKYGTGELKNHTVSSVIQFNQQDTTLYAPYGQLRLEGILKDSTSNERLVEIKDSLMLIAREYFEAAMDEHKLDAILSINNYSAGYAAVAHFPALTLPMGYADDGRPMGITLIGKSWSEYDLLKVALKLENIIKAREIPEGYN